MIRRTFLAGVTPVGPQQLRAIIATEELGRDNLIIRLAGIQAPDSMTGLFNHDPALPVCRWSELDGVRHGSPALATFPPIGTSAKADEVCRLAKEGTLDSVSIGFEPLEMQPADPKIYPRGAKICVRSELLECSWVSIPADRGAKVVERNYRRALADRLDDLRQDVEEAEEHHRAVGQALRRGETSEALRAHRRLGQSLRNVGMSLDQLKSSKSQTSAGTTWGTSDGDGPKSLEAIDRPRAAPSSLCQRQLEAALLAAPMPVGGAAGCAAIRDREFARAQLHIEAAARAGGAFYRPPSRAERQVEAERLRRLL